MKPESVIIETDKDLSKYNLLDAALKKSGFDDIIEQKRIESKKAKAEFRIVIKPNLAMFFKEKVTITDPELVEYLIDWLHDKGFTNVVLGEAQNTFLKWLNNREIPNILFSLFAGV